MLKLISLLRRPEGMSKEDVPHVGARRARRARTAAPGPALLHRQPRPTDDDSPYDCVNELYFDDEEARAAAFASERGPGGRAPTRPRTRPSASTSSPPSTGSFEVSPEPGTADELGRLLEDERYFADAGLLTAIQLALALGRPLLLEGEPGVGKTEVGNVLARVLGRELSASSATRAWTPRRRSTSGTTRSSCSPCAPPRPAARDIGDVYDERFLLERPLLRAVRSPAAVLLLVDEIDRSDSEFEAFLLEFLSDFQITIPELGTLRAAQPPVVVITSNRTRELHDALKRRCLYHWIPLPEPERERAIVRARAPGVEEAAAAALVEAVNAVRVAAAAEAARDRRVDRLGAGRARCSPPAATRGRSRCGARSGCSSRTRRTSRVVESHAAGGVRCRRLTPTPVSLAPPTTWTASCAASATAGVRVPVPQARRLPAGARPWSRRPAWTASTGLARVTLLTRLDDVEALRRVFDAWFRGEPRPRDRATLPRGRGRGRGQRPRRARLAGRAAARRTLGEGSGVEASGGRGGLPQAVSDAAGARRATCWARSARALPRATADGPRRGAAPRRRGPASARPGRASAARRTAPAARSSGSTGASGRSRAAARAPARRRLRLGQAAQPRPAPLRARRGRGGCRAPRSFTFGTRLTRVTEQLREPGRRPRARRARRDRARRRRRDADRHGDRRAPRQRPRTARSSAAPPLVVLSDGLERGDCEAMIARRATAWRCSATASSGGRRWRAAPATGRSRGACAACWRASTSSRACATSNLRCERCAACRR